jgi:L-threonylcarbamoyladenylate synthase
MNIVTKLEKTWTQKVKSGYICLHPSDTLWVYSTSAFSRRGYQNLIESTSDLSDDPISIIVDSIPHLKKYVYNLHPRIETLLHYHDRPLTLLYKQVKMLPEHLLTKEGLAPIGITHDEHLKKLIDNIKQPLIYRPLRLSLDSYATSLKEIPDVLRKRATVIYHPDGHVFKQSDVGKPAVVGQFDREGTLVF